MSNFQIKFDKISNLSYNIKRMIKGEKINGFKTWQFKTL